MNDRYYRLRDIEKGKRLKHFLEYYKLHVLIGFVLLSSLAYLLYGVLRPKPDLMVLWMSGSYSYEKENALRTALEDMEWLENGKHGRKPMLTYIEFTDTYEKLSYQTMSEINTLVGGQQYSFFLVNEDAVNWMEKSDILGSCADAGLSRSEKLVIPLAELPMFSTEKLSGFRDLFLVISSPDTGKNDSAEYERQTAALRSFLSAQGFF